MSIRSRSAIAAVLALLVLLERIACGGSASDHSLRSAGATAGIARQRTAIVQKTNSMTSSASRTRNDPTPPVFA